MTDHLRKAAEMALEALESAANNEGNFHDYKYAANALRQALAQPEQEPVARVVLTQNLGLPTMQWLDLTRQFVFKGGEFLYTAPPSKPWVSLTDEEIDYIWGVTPPDYENFFEFPRAIEAKLREKNT